MATYEQIQTHIKRKYGFYVATCWIAHVKEICGLSPRRAPNRINPRKRDNPCPQSKISLIKQAFKHFGII
jgi:hypothetical protein